MMNRWNCRPKQKRGKSKWAERSIGFSPLIPAKQVHTGGNPFFISVTDIRTVSFGNTPLYLLATPYPFISNVHSHERYLAALHTRQRPAFFPLPFLHSFDREQAGQPHTDTPYTPIVGSPSVEIHRKSSPMGWSDGIPACAVSILPVNGMFPIPGILPGFMPE